MALLTLSGPKHPVTSDTGPAPAPARAPQTHVHHGWPFKLKKETPSLFQDDDLSEEEN